MDIRKKLEKGLREIFGFKEYLNQVQRDGVENVWDARRDVILRGFGKSLCYQLPVMMKQNTFIIVISCRISYIKMQQRFFKTKNIETSLLTSNTSKKQRMSMEKDITSESSNIKILFITPYQYESAYFKTTLRKVNKQRLFYIVLDQADNIIGQQENLKKQYENLDLKIIRVPIVAVSATATPEAQEDIKTKFRLLNPKIYSMPVLRSNLYYDMWYINTLPDPLEHLMEFIKNCHCFNNDENVKKESWGIIVCEDLDASKRLAKYLTFAGVAALPYSSNAKGKVLRDVTNVQVITVPNKVEEAKMLTVTNSLAQKIARKFVRFIVFWDVFPSIQKYYFQSSQARYFHGISYCRTYCQLEELMDNSVQLSSSHDESVHDIRASLLQIECRHKIYSKYCGDTFYECKYYCDVCEDREKVKQKITGLLEITNDECLETKLREILLNCAKNSTLVCDENLHSEETVSSEYQTMSTESDAVKRKNRYKLRKWRTSLVKISNRELDKKSHADNPSQNASIQCLKKNNGKLDKKSQANNPSQDVSIQCFKKKNGRFDEASQADNPSQDVSIQCLEKNNCGLDKISQAISALSDTYKYLRGKQQSSSKPKGSKTTYRKTKIKRVEVITLDDSDTEDSSVHNKSAQLDENVLKSDERDDDVIFIKECRKRPSTQDLNLERKKRRK